MCKRIYTILLLLIGGLTLIPFTSYGTAIKLSDTITSVNVNEHVELLKAGVGEYDSTDLTSSHFLSKFKTPTSSALNFGYTDSVYWVKFLVDHQKTSDNNWLLEVNYPALDWLTFYKPDSGGHYQSYATGDRFPVSQREISYRNFLFTIPNHHTSVKIYFLKIHTESSMVIDLRLWKDKAFYKESQNISMGHGLYYGIIAIMVIYHLILFLALRDMSYLYYILFIGGVGFYQFILSGFSAVYIWPDSPYINNLANPFFVGFAILWGMLFTRKFLNTAKRFPYYDYALLGVIGLCGISMLSTFVLSYSVSAGMSDLLVIISAVTSFSAGLWAWYKGYRAARYFVWAWVALSLGVIMLAMGALGVLPLNFITQYGVYYGIISLVILLSLALADRINLIQQEKTEAQQQVIEQLRKMERYRQKVNEELEQKVKERTQEIEYHKKLIEQKNQDLTDSINYAKRIQEAILPAYKLVVELLPEAFILYKPRDIVSGDFYWLEQKNGKILIAAVDCTGHGVPGAFMSMVGGQLLNKIVVEGNLHEPGQILSRLNWNIKTALKQDKENAQTHDGMDIALCSMDKDSRALQFSGAQRPLYIVREGQLIEQKGDPEPIGGRTQVGYQFDTHKLDLKKDDVVYMFSDGYPDQFGGEHLPEIREGGKKFMVRRFKKLLTEIAHHPMEKQKKILNETLVEWQGDWEQIDDILVMGVRVG